MTAKPSFGPLLTKRGVTFRLWAPAASRVSLMLDAPHDMPKNGDWFELHVPKAKAGTRYRFKIDDDIEIADPASHFQPDDVQGSSEVIDHHYDWQAPDWKGLPWEQAIFLEAHAGTFTREGTFRAMIERLDHLVATGITALELMPVADFPGRWNWGYDGVLLYAPDSTYGRPEDLKALIDAAHSRGLMVFLDVVYNHFGPDGNYLGRIAPSFFSDAQTPWGAAINYEVDEVRAFAIENAVHWLRDYRFDGLRLDAVHAIATPGEVHMLTDLSMAVGELATKTDRYIHLVLENDDNLAAVLAPEEDPPAGRYRAQWNDDYHHAWHVFLTGETAGYYSDYADAQKHITRTLAEGFAFQGEASPHRGGALRGEPSGSLPRTAFVNFLQNHDQIGNRPLGERLAMLAKPEAVEAALAVLLLQPSPPMLFMGEEWSATEPFPFFCDFRGDLAQAVRDGRKREFAEAYAQRGDAIPDPIAQETRDAAVLDWDARSHPVHAQRLAFTRSLLAARKKWIVPLLAGIKGKGEVAFSSNPLTARWQAGDKTLLLLANLSDNRHERPNDLQWGQPVWGGSPPRDLPPWSVYAAIGG
ncbi:MAG: malto-oligosyltrehalose trehalohydrolase [Pseudolabrys sp.]|nr:malto-oligosyltrehalose trehalohydrolase [Pseudolabrys sp.]MDP2296926.1 malto-oligosyltrehalose trehalohydrolase [Pseudolabrys sp.]